MEEGFTKGSSDNLPIVNSDMVDDFYRRNLDFLVAEVRNVKTKRASRESYGDNAVGYVQLKREGPLCTTKAKVTPEHKVHQKSYNVVVTIDEAQDRIIACKCTDCAASAGGCKHGVAFLFWLHRRSEEPSVTSTTCYWRASRLAREMKTRQNMDLASLVGHDLPPLAAKKGAFLSTITENIKGATGGVFDFFREDVYNAASIYHLVLKYAEEAGMEDVCPNRCIEFMKSAMTSSLCKEIETGTRNQAHSPLWYQMRFGRITASRIYEASRCKTAGALKEAILGATTVETAPMLRGSMLEPEVLSEVARKTNIKINKVGLVLNAKYPIFGASPDGISEEFVVEVKCPSKESSIGKYVSNGKVKAKYFAQINMQMFFSNKAKGLFCVALPSFEVSKEVEIYEVNFDLEKCEALMEHASEFWKLIIFPSLTQK